MNTMMSCDHALPCGRLQHFQFHLVVRRPNVLDVPRATP